MAGRDLSEELFGSAPPGGRDLSDELFGPPAAPPPPPEGGFIPAVQRGALQTSSLLFDILPAMAARAVGADEYAEKQFKEAAETERKIQEKYAAAVPSYKDIKGVGDAVTYITESVGELVPSILPSLVTGGIAGIAGRGAVIAAKEAAEAAARKRLAEEGAEALAKKEVQDEIRQAGIDAARRTAVKYDAAGVVGGSSLQNIPEVYKNIKDETEQESLGTALLFGGFNSLLDAALPLSVLTKLRKSGVPEEQVIGAWYKRFGVGATKGFATEGATEAAQEMSSAAAEKFIDNNIEFFSEKNLERFLNAGLKGGLGGGVVSGTTDVMLGKKSLTDDLKPLDEDIRNTQSDILARRAFLDELRAQADEEGRNRLNDEALKDLGIRKGALYDSLLDKDINDPAQAEQAKLTLAQFIQGADGTRNEKVKANDALNLIGEYQSVREAEPDVGQVVETTVGEGVPVPVGPSEVAAPGVEGVERDGVVPAATDVAVAPPGEGVPPAPVEAPIEAPVPEVAQAPVQTAPAPEVAVQPAPAEAVAPAPEVTVPTTRELIAEQEAGLAKQMEKFQGLLQEQVKRYGLKDVGVKVIDDLKNANGMYSKGLIQLAVDTADPVRALRHESVHALKELGFFTPAQWQSLVKQANTTWVNTYMRNRDVDGNYLQPGQESRYDAYINLFKQQGLDDAAIQEAMVEEAIADAFGDFSTAKAAPGMIRALINRMKNFFQSIKESVGLAGIPTSENIFGKIAEGRLESVAKRGAADEAREPKQAIRAVQPERAGERGGREEVGGLAPLEGAPSVPGFSGPDPRLVEVAEQYAKDNGISLKRQSAYAEVDEEFAKRIAQAYEEMPHAPNDPAVREAYENMIRQTRAQYDALVDAGYKFWFIDLDKPSNVEYASTPWNAMRDIRANKEMGVFPTNDGFGSLEEFSPEANPLLADTGLKWPVGGPDGEPAPVLANDLFRAVHDAFGHGLEGSGFRARGEENAWQAHRHLFTGSAVGALTSETRGQNSWLNYGPYGEKNRNAKVEDTVFADQKTGLMPEWTWQEKITPDALAAPEAEPDAKFSLRIVRGQEVPEIDGRITVDKIGKYFDDRVKQEFGRQLDYTNPEDFARAIAVASEEAAYQIKLEKSGLDWYEDDVRLAFEDTAKVIKELNTEENRILFSVMAGIMSPNAIARDNWYIAAKAFQHYVKTGDIPGINPENNRLWLGGTTSVNKRIQLEFLDRMVKDMGKDAAIKWLLSDHTVKEINQFRSKYGNIKSGIDGKLNDIKPGLYAFGPKVGPFVSNLNGIHDVTVDKWMTRTFNRYFGTVADANGKNIEAPTEPQRRAIKDLINKVAQDANLKPYQVQSLLWFYEQRLYNQIGVPVESYGFSDGGRKFLEESRRGGGAPSVATPAQAPAKVKKAEPPKFSISGPRLTPELRQAAQGSAIVDADGNLIPMYHGTAAAIRIFRPKQAGATFVSPDPRFASGYTSASRMWMVRHIGQFLKPDEIRKAVQELRQAVYSEYGKQSKMTSKIMDEIHDVLREAKETGVYNFRGELQDKWYEIAFDMIPGAKERVMELYVLAKKPFDFENKADVNAVVKKMLEDPDVKRFYGYAPAPAGVDIFKPENFMLRQTLERSDKEYKAAVEGKFKDALSNGSWTNIESPPVQKAIKALGFDSFYVIEGGTKNLGVYDPRLIKSADENVGPFGQRPPTEEEAAALGMEPAEAEKAQAEGDIRLSLRSQVDPAITARMLQTTTARDQKGFVERIIDSIGPESRSRFRAAALNRYNRLGEVDKLKLARMGGADLYADATAESAALLSDLASGIVAGSLGVYDKIGGVPVYNRYYAIEKQVPGPQGMQFIQVGGKISDRRAAEALAKRVGGEVKERGYVAVSNKDNTIKGPLAIFAPLAKYGDPDIYRYYQFWSGVKRGEKWMTNAQGRVVKERLFTPQDIQKAKDLEAQFPEFATIQKEWITYNDALVQFMLDTGVLSQKQADEYRKHGDYMPFYRQIQGDDDAVGPRIFQPISAVKQPRKLKGGEDPLGDFLENMVRNTQSAVQAGMKNIASRRAADVGKDVGMVDRVPAGATPDPINSFYVLENGEKVYYDTKDALFIESIKSLGLPEFPGIGLLAAPANVLRNLVTKDPGFMLANMMRDSLAAWTTSGVNMTPIAATLANFTKAVAGQSPEFRTLQMAGVIGGYDYSQGTKEATEQFGKELRRTAGAQTAGEKAMRPFTYLWEGLEKGTQASDAATRIEVYKATLKETGNEAEALFRALEVMNFNRKGNNPIVRVATAAIPFLNARMQGLDVLYRAAFGRNATKNAAEIQKAFWVRGMTLAALSTMYWLLTHDDEEYKRQEQETKDNNWLFPSLGIRVPIPFEVGVLFKVIPERIAALTLGDDTAKDFTTSMARNLASTLAVNPIPQTILPIVEATTNFSFFTFRPIVGQGLEGVAPGYQVGAGTSRLAEALGKSTNISPMKIDQILQGYTGTIGQYMSDTIDAVWNMHAENPKASKRFEQLPVVKRFVVNPDARGQVTAYFDLKNSVDEATRTANLLERSMNFEEYGKYMSENIQMFAFKDYILDLEKTMKEYRDTKNMIRSLPMDADQKRDSIRAIDQIENQITANIQTLKKQMQ